MCPEQLVRWHFLRFIIILNSAIVFLKINKIKRRVRSYLHHEGYPDDSLRFMLCFRHVMVQLFIKPIYLNLEAEETEKTSYYNTLRGSFAFS